LGKTGGAIDKPSRDHVFARFHGDKRRV